MMTYTSVADSVTNSLQTIAGDAVSVLGAVAPVALSVAGAFLVWKLGMKFFKSIAK